VRECLYVYVYVCVRVRVLLRVLRIGTSTSYHNMNLIFSHFKINFTPIL